MLVINVVMLHNAELILMNWSTGEFVHSFMLFRQVSCCWAISSTYLKVFILLFLIMWMSMGLCVGVWTWLPVSTGTRRCQISWSWSYHMTWVLGTEYSCFGKAVHASYQLSHFSSSISHSPVLSILFWNMSSPSYLVEIWVCDPLVLAFWDDGTRLEPLSTTSILCMHSLHGRGLLLFFFRYPPTTMYSKPRV